MSQWVDFSYDASNTDQFANGLELYFTSDVNEIRIAGIILTHDEQLNPHADISSLEIVVPGMRMRH